MKNSALLKKTQQFKIYNFYFTYLYRKQIMRARSAMVRKAGTIDNEMQHQNQKNKMLEEDRRLFLRQAQEIKEKYKQEIQKLKNQNKKLKSIRDEFISNKRNKFAMSRTGFNPNDNSSKGVVNLTDQNYLRIMLDKEKHQTKVRKNMLFTLQDKLKEVEDNKLGYIEENPMMRTIRILENRLDKVMIKYNQSQSIQQTYEQVVKRLKEERVGYDSQLAAIQNCLKGKEHDFEELLLLAHDATHAKEAAFAQLKRFEQRKITVQQMRSKYINQKKEDIGKQIPQQNDGPMKGQRSTYDNKANAVFGTSYKHDQNYQRQQLNDYQEAFRKLKQVTGVIDANQIIQKFKTQGLTTRSLEQLQTNYSNKIEDMKKERDDLKKRMENNKFVRDREGPERRRLDQIESDLAKMTNQYQRTNIKYTKLSSSMINIKAGIQHLKEMTVFYKRQGQIQNGSLQEELKNLNQKLRRMYDVVKTDPNYMKHSYKINANQIQAKLSDQKDFKNYNSIRANQDDEDSDQN